MICCASHTCRGCRSNWASSSINYDGVLGSISHEIGSSKCDRCASSYSTISWVDSSEQWRESARVCNCLSQIGKVIIVFFYSNRARVSCTRVVNGFYTRNLQLWDVTTFALIVVQSIESILWLIGSIFPLLVIPAFVNIFINSVEVSPCGIVSWALEL